MTYSNRFCPPPQQKTTKTFVANFVVCWCYNYRSSNRNPLSILSRANLLYYCPSSIPLHFWILTIRLRGSHRPLLCPSWPNLAPWFSSSPGSSCASQKIPRKWCGCERSTSLKRRHIATEKRPFAPKRRCLCFKAFDVQGLLLLVLWSVGWFEKDVVSMIRVLSFSWITF